MFAISAPGLEQIVASEIRGLGITDAETVEGGVTFTGNQAQLYAVNLELRVASRVLIRVDEFHADSFHELERRARKIRWEEYLLPGSRVRFRVTCRKSRLYHSDAVAERLGEAVTQRVKRVALFSVPGQLIDTAEDESDEEASPQLFVVRLTHDNCVVSADSSGSLLHRRGYRKATGKAPLRETLAAAMVTASGWDPASPLLDPMCGSGTIPIEAALIARHIAPGIGRTFAFQNWPNHDSVTWNTLVAKAQHRAVSAIPAAIVASDNDDDVVISARANAKRAGVENDIEWNVRPISGFDPPPPPGWIVTNPPYGVRVGERAPLRNLYAQLGKVMRLRAPGYSIALLSADSMLESMLNLRLEEVFRTTNGGLPVRLVKGRAS